MLVALINWWIILYLDLVCMIEIYVMRLYCIFPRSKRKLAKQLFSILQQQIGIVFPNALEI